MARDPQLTRYLQWDAWEDQERAFEFIGDARRLWTSGTAYLPTIFSTETQQAVGVTGLSSIDRLNGRAEIGTWIGRRWQGRRYNLPAKAAILTLAFELLELERVEFLITVDNTPSLAATRSLPGIVEEGVLHSRIRRRDGMQDAVIFAITRRAWSPASWPDVTIRGRLDDPPR